jgi:RimJ/RimL family protein N-acetyltransferase
MAQVADVRVLVPGDEAQLFRFLTPHLESSLFFFSNIEKAGLLDGGEALQGTYVARFDAAGAITAVAGHSWNGNVMLQGDEGLEAAALHAVSRSGRVVRGLIGPWALVCRARQALQLEQTRAVHDDKELLFTLSLDQLAVPALLSRADVALRAPSEAEAVDLLSPWRADYHVESLGAPRTPELAEAAREQMRSWRSAGTLWVLTVAGEIVAMTGFNAETRGVCQVGGVFTPPALRSRGYARSAVAASLQLAQKERGANRSVLFTAETNQAACHTYLSLGYRVVGDFGLVLF